MEMKKENDNRIVLYDSLRFIAIFFVVLGHSAYVKMHTFFGGVSYTVPTDVNSLYSIIFSIFNFLAGWVYTFHMPLFFVLSGAVLGLKPICDFDKFFSSKIKRLIIPYFVYGWLFMLPIKYLCNFYDNTHLVQAYRGFLSGIDAGHLWFLPALFWCMVVFVLLKKFCNRFTNSLFIILIISGIIQIMSKYLPFDVLLLKRGLSYIFWFACGFILENYRTNFQLLNKFKAEIFFFVILLLIEIINCKFHILNKIFGIIVGVSFSFLLADICTHVSFINKIVQNKFIIRNLFYVYIFHDPLNYLVLRVYFDNNLLSSAVGCCLYPFFRIIVLFVVSLLLGELIWCIKRRLKNSFNKK